MMMFNNFRRVSLSFAALVLVVAPVGCNSDAPPSAVVEIKHEPNPSPTPLLDKIARDLDRDVRQTTGELKQEAEEVKKSVEADKHELKATEDTIKKSAEGTVDNVLGDPK